MKWESMNSMTINEWLNENFKHITLYDTIVKGSNILKVPEINSELTCGLISTNNKEDLAEIKIVIEIMKKQIAQLEQKLGLVTIKTPLFTEEDLKEMANMKKK